MTKPGPKNMTLKITNKIIAIIKLKIVLGNLFLLIKSTFLIFSENSQILCVRVNFFVLEL